MKQIVCLTTTKEHLLLVRSTAERSEHYDVAHMSHTGSVCFVDFALESPEAASAFAVDMFGLGDKVTYSVSYTL